MAKIYKWDKVSIILRIDPDKTSLLELVDNVNRLGYRAIERIYHKKIGYKNEDFRNAWSDVVLLEITDGLICGVIIDIFICHCIDTPILAYVNVPIIELVDVSIIDANKVSENDLADN